MLPSSLCHILLSLVLRTDSFNKLKGLTSMIVFHERIWSYAWTSMCYFNYHSILVVTIYIVTYDIWHPKFLILIRLSMYICGLLATSCIMLCDLMSNMCILQHRDCILSDFLLSEYSVWYSNSFAELIYWKENSSRVYSKHVSIIAQYNQPSVVAYLFDKVGLFFSSIIAWHKQLLKSLCPVFCWCSLLLDGTYFELGKM